jgi:hypothetical protein
MTEYFVTWQISLDADSPREAAEKAREMQEDPESIAVVYEVEWPNPDRPGCTLAETVDLIGHTCQLCGNAVKLTGDPEHPYAWSDENGETACPIFYADCGACQDGESHPHEPTEDA